MTLRPTLALLPTLLCTPLLSAPAQESGTGEAWILSLRQDPEVQQAALAELEALRRAGVGEAFRARGRLLGEEVAALASPLRALAAELDVEVLAQFRLSPALGVWIESAAELEALRAHPSVAGAELASQRGPNLVQATAAHHLPAVHQMQLGGNLLQGHGVTIALFDSGLDLSSGATGRPHAAFYSNGNPAAGGPGLGGSRVLSSVDVAVLPCAGHTGEDQTGHGTRMGSIAAGAAWNAQPSVGDGAAPEAWLRNYKIADCGTSNASTLAMAWAFDQAALEPDVRVINLSYDGTSSATYFLNETMDKVALTGVTVVLSAGNSGTSTPFMHGSYNPLVVGSSFQAQAQPYVFPGFQTSAVGPLPDGRRYPQMLAVGEQITCAKLDDEAGSLDSYGTSGAAALTSGTAALLYQAVPTLSALEVKALLIDSAAPVVAGDGEASGYGFLDAEAAVQQAQAGKVRSAVALQGFEVWFNVDVSAPSTDSLTLVFDRHPVFSADAPDLDLELRRTDGSVLASSVAGLDNVEQISLVGIPTGSYRAVVRTLAQHQLNNVPFALAGVSTNPEYQPFSCTPGAPVVEVVTPGAVASGGQFARFFLKGCGLGVTQSVTVGGVPASFQADSDLRLEVSLPAGLALGAQPVVVSGPNGSDSSVINVGLAGPALTCWANFVSDLAWQLDGSSGQAYGVLFSGVVGPTALPGIVDLDIGNGVAGLFVHQLGLLNTFGEAEGKLVGGATLPNGTQIYLQAVVFDLATLTLVPSNVSQALKAVHFG